MEKPKAYKNYISTVIKYLNPQNLNPQQEAENIFSFEKELASVYNSKSFSFFFFLKFKIYIEFKI